MSGLPTGTVTFFFAFTDIEGSTYAPPAFSRARLNPRSV